MYTEYCGFNCFVAANGQQPRKRKGEGNVKFCDQLALSSTSVSSSGTILSLTDIPQGSNVNQRTGDSVYIEKLYVNYTVNAANNDVYSSLRVIIFQWKVNTQITAVNPTPTNILQNVVAFGIYNFYDWNLSNQFIILYDRIHSLSGISTAPTASTNQCFFGEIPLDRAIKKLEFQAGSTNGNNQIFLLVISDSSVIPFPNFVMNSRLIYTDNI